MAVVIFALAFLLRFLHIAAIYKRSPFWDVLPGDPGAYDRWVQKVVERDGLGKLQMQRKDYNDARAI